MHTLSAGRFLKFDQHLRVYNWYYPLLRTGAVPFTQRKVADLEGALAEPRSRIENTTLYLHIPFCETICTFCPFVRGQYSGNEIVEEYVKALILEIRMKAALTDGGSLPIKAIYIGGGTPSVLAPEQIGAIGRALAASFDLSGVDEFSCEVEAKSLTAEKAQALAAIGVNRISFGVQTFDRTYRSLFNLTASLDQIYGCALLAKRYVGRFGIDILYGFDGQSLETMFADLEQALLMQPDTINYYPINNLTTQIVLHDAYVRQGLQPKTGADKLAMRMAGDAVLRACGYRPCNGHSYIRGATPDAGAMVAPGRHFLYHHLMHGYAGDTVLGFGTSAFSYTGTHVMFNDHSRNRYIRRLAGEELPEGHVDAVTPEQAANRGYVVHLPYAGQASKHRLDAGAASPEVLARVEEMMTLGLIGETEDRLMLTGLGWYWYVNVMYLLMPGTERCHIDAFIGKALQEPGRRDGESFLLAAE